MKTERQEEGEGENREINYLVGAGRAIMKFMPKAVHGRTKKAYSEHKWHEASHSSSEAWFGSKAGQGQEDGLVQFGTIKEGQVNSSAIVI